MLSGVNMTGRELCLHVGESLECGGGARRRDGACRAERPKPRASDATGARSGGN